MHEELLPVWWEWPEARIQQYISHERGIPDEFVVQLEYDHNAAITGQTDDDWRQVARFDHDRDGAHDVSEEGLHLDVYREGHKFEVFEDFPEVSLPKAPDFCLTYLTDHHDYFLTRYESWHDIDGRFRKSVSTPSPPQDYR